MDKKPRRQIQMKIVDDVSTLGQITNEELLADSEKYDAENYNPLDNLDEKEILIPNYKSEVITVRLNSSENEYIRRLSLEYGISKSGIIRYLINSSLKKKDQDPIKLS